MRIDTIHIEKAKVDLETVEVEDGEVAPPKKKRTKKAAPLIVDEVDDISDPESEEDD